MNFWSSGSWMDHQRSATQERHGQTRQLTDRRSRKGPGLSIRGLDVPEKSRSAHHPFHRPVWWETHRVGRTCDPPSSGIGDGLTTASPGQFCSEQYDPERGNHRDGGAPTGTRRPAYRVQRGRSTDRPAAATSFKSPMGVAFNQIKRLAERQSSRFSTNPAKSAA